MKQCRLKSFWHRSLLAFLTSAVVIFGSEVSACTVMRFDCDGHLVVARNHDWMFGEGWLIVHPRGLNKQAITPLRPAKWTSKYGSVSLTQFGRGIPFAGMNEKGLTVDLLQLHEAEFPAAQSFNHDAVDVIQWVQYQLDMSASVEDVVSSLEVVWPTPLLAEIEKVHYFVTDAAGEVAIVEFLRGKPVVHRGGVSNDNQTENCALANTIHSVARASLSKGHRSRYATAVNAVEDSMRQDQIESPVELGIESLQSVANLRLTHWTLIYEPQDLKLTFETKLHPVQRSIDLKQLDFSPDAKVMILSLQEGSGGNAITALREITNQDHAEIVNSGFDQYMPDGIGRVLLKKLITDFPKKIKPSGSVAVEQAGDR